MGKSRSQTVLADLFEAHHPWLLDRLRLRLRNRADAEDLASDTFAQIVAQRDALPALTQPRAYLATIARRLLFHFWRRRELERAYLDWLAATADALAPSPETRAITMEALLRIDRLLDGLPPPVRATFLYSQLDGLPQEEIAARLGLSVRTVQRHITRGLERCLLAGRGDAT